MEKVIRAKFNIKIYGLLELKEEDILEDAKVFAQEAIDILKDISPEEPFGNKVDVERGTGTITRVGLKWVALNLRYFPYDLRERMMKSVGKDETKKVMYGVGKASGVDIHERFKVLGLGDVESLLAVLSTSVYSGWGVPVLKNVQVLVETIISFAEEMIKRDDPSLGIKEVANNIRNIEKYCGGKIGILSKDELKVNLFLYWINSFVSESCLYQGTTKGPTCEFLAGVVEGVEKILVDSIVESKEKECGTKIPFEINALPVKEISCKSTGQKFCTFNLAIRIRRKK